jgi:hypothetical protein
MAVILKKNFSYIFNSDPVAGAQNISSDGSQFSTTLNLPLYIPKNAIDASAGVLQANIWNTSPNISPAFNNNIFTFTTLQAPAGTYTITIPEGLYSLDGLNTYISSQLVNLGLPSTLISIGGDFATQSSILVFSFAGDSVDFTVPDSVRTVLGFNSEILTAPSNNFTFYSENPAEFNRNNSYIIASNFVSQGIPVNNLSAGIISLVPIDVAPSSQIVYQPQNVIWFDIGELIGNQKLNINFRLLNQNLQATPTAGQTWSFVLMIKYNILLSTSVLPLKPS